MKKVKLNAKCKRYEDDFLPMHSFDSLDELNAYLHSKCQKRLEQRWKDDKHQTINDRLIEEQCHFLSYIHYSGYQTKRLTNLIVLNIKIRIIFSDVRWSIFQ
jgi:uncharacterized membrane protein